MASYESEKLQETLLDLLRSKEREQQLQAENNAILAGISAMAGATNKRQVFNGLLAVLRKYIGFEHALVLTRDDETTVLEELVTTCSDFENSVWPVHHTFNRCLNGESIALFSPSSVFEFQFLDESLLTHCQSALLTGVKVSSGDALLLFFHSGHGQFTPRCRRVLNRFRPLLERAIIDIDYRERLQSLVTIRTQELTHSQKRFKDFAKTVGDWFWEIDTNYTFTYISAPNIADHIIDSDHILAIFGQQEDIKRQLKQKLDEQVDFEDLEWCLFNDKKETIWISLSGTPYFNKQNVLMGYRGTAKDITIRKKRIVELQEAQQVAEEANKAKSEFLAMMSHEIRTPLNAVMGFLDTLSNSGLNEEQSSWVDHMDQSAQLLLTIINDVLDLSRIESGSFDLCLSEMSLHDAINLPVSQLTDQALKKNIELQCHLSPSTPAFIYGDKNRIAQVMFNLIGNAIKFTNKGSVKVETRYLTSEGILIIEVIDSGIGIKKESQPNLFNPFIQADGGITRKYGGTGLGLSISQHLIKKMSGSISLRSEYGVGSTFTVSLPMIEIIPSYHSVPLFMEEETVKSLSILLAEDSKTNQVVARLMLEKRGHIVDLANNGQEAIDAILNQSANQKYDLVLMDISMPILDGLKATRKIREKGLSIPIIALTANAMNSDKKACKDVGMDDFLSKPIQASDLNQILYKYQHSVN